MVVSSNTLFQFTSSIDVVKNILVSKGFWPKYCTEYGWKKLFAVPQCCFCDIPLSAIQIHMKTYGEYGFGMQKDWGIRNQVAPVAYLLKESPMVKTLSDIFRSKRNCMREKENERRFLAFIKIYKGVYYRIINGTKRQFKAYSYYNEREWRYVPMDLCPERLVQVVNDKVKFDYEKESECTRKYLCKFDAKNIRYIIVKSDDDRMELIKFIATLKNWDENSKTVLCSRIITNQLITEDI